MLQAANRSPWVSMCAFFIIATIIAVTLLFLIVPMFGFGDPFGLDLPIIPVSNDNIPPNLRIEIDKALIALNEQTTIYRRAYQLSVILAAASGIATAVVGAATSTLKLDTNRNAKIFLAIISIVAIICTSIGAYQAQSAKSSLEGAAEIDTTINTVLDDFQEDNSQSQIIRYIFRIRKVVGKYSSIDLPPNTLTVTPSTP